MTAASILMLLVLRALCLVTLAGGQPKAPLKCSIHCNGFTSAIAEWRIRSHRWTEPGCRKQAIIFTTLKSKQICADPRAEWVKKIIKKLDQKKATASPLPGGAISPEEPGGFQKHVGPTVTAPSQATAPVSFFHGTGTTVWERINASTARTEVASKSPTRQNSTQVPAGSSPVIQEDAVHSEVTQEANSHSLNSSASSTSAAAGVDSIQPTPQPTTLVHGFDNTGGSTKAPLGHPANAIADVQGTASPNSNSMATQNPVATTEGSDQPVLSTNECLDSTSARATAPHTTSSSSRSDPPSILHSVDFLTSPDAPVAPETSSISSLNFNTATDEGTSVASVGSSTDGFGTRTSDYSSPAGKQEPSDTSVFAGQAFPGQARVQMTTDKPNARPLPSFLSMSQMHFVIPVSVVSGVTVCSVALVWLYLKYGVKPEESSREMIQGLLYQKTEHQNNVYPMEVI